MDNTKSQLGQFYTTNYSYILNGMIIPPNSVIVEPFCGKGDLLNFANRFNPKEIRTFDIDPKQDGIERRDTLKHPPSYQDTFVLTNPPYLAKNKHKGDKSVFVKYKQDDLYKCFIESIIRSPCSGGIIIIPLNFWSSIRRNDSILRERFVNVYKTIRVNVFEESVFKDTAYTVCSILFRRKKYHDSRTCEDVDMHFYPSRDRLTIKVGEYNRYTIGGDVLWKLPQTQSYKVERATRLNKDCAGLTNILLKNIDDTSTSRICLKIVSDEEIQRHVDRTEKLSSRSYASLIITPPIPLDKQKEVVDIFNARLEKWRGQFRSLFLTNYRENNRKRISYTLAFKMVNYILR